MHIRKADARRRFGRTSWDDYGKEAAEAEGFRRSVGVISGRRDEMGRLSKLDGMWLGDLKALLAPMALEDLEITLCSYRSGQISREEFEKELPRILREGHVMRSIGKPYSRGSPAQVKEARLAKYEEMGISTLVCEYPFVDTWLYRMRKATGGVGLGALIAQDAFEELAETGFTEATRRAGLLDDPPAP